MNSLQEILVNCKQVFYKDRYLQKNKTSHPFVWMMTGFVRIDRLDLFVITFNYFLRKTRLAETPPVKANNANPNKAKLFSFIPAFGRSSLALRAAKRLKPAVSDWLLSDLLGFWPLSLLFEFWLVLPFWFVAVPFSPVWLFVSFFEISNQIPIYRVQKSRLTLSYQAFSDFWSWVLFFSKEFNFH